MTPYIFPGISRRQQRHVFIPNVIDEAKPLFEKIMAEIEANGGVRKMYYIALKELNGTNEKKIKKTLTHYNYSIRYIQEHWHTMKVSDIAKNLGSNKTQILRRAKQLGLGKKTRCRVKYQYAIQETMLILDEKTGIFYPNASEAARASNLNIRTTQWRLKLDNYYKHLKIV